MKMYRHPATLPGLTSALCEECDTRIHMYCNDDNSVSVWLHEIDQRLADHHAYPKRTGRRASITIEGVWT